MAFQRSKIIYMLRDGEPQINLSVLEVNAERVMDIGEMVQRFRLEYAEVAKEYEEGEGNERLFELEIYSQMTETEKPVYRMYFIECRTTQNANRVYTRLRNRIDFPEIEFMQFDEEIEIYHQPNDPLFINTWGMSKIRAQEAWDIDNNFGKDVVIAVIDTGIDYNHPDIAGSMWRDAKGNCGWDAADGNDNPMDHQGHGTHVAGTIAATIDNATGIAGVAANAKLMAVKISEGTGRFMSDMSSFRGIRYAVDNGALILNNSWGPTARRPVNNGLKIMIDFALSKGVIVVFAAGNFNDDVAYYFPANYDKIICVGATNEQDQRSIFFGGLASNFGDTVTLSAPGSDILSLQNNTTSYTTKSGTSMACPHVTGVLALMIGAKNNLTPPEKLSIAKANYYLRNSVDPINPDEYLGWGRLNALKAVQEAKKPTQISGIVIQFNLTDDDKDKEEEIQVWVENAGRNIGFGRFGRGTKWRDPGEYPCLVKTPLFSETELDSVTVRFFKVPDGSQSGNGMEGSIDFFVVYNGGFWEKNIHIPEARYGDNNPYDVTFNLRRF